MAPRFLAASTQHASTERSAATQPAKPTELTHAASAYGEASLLLAGQVLASSSAADSELEVARTLLREAWIAAARALCRDRTIASIDDASATLARHPELAPLLDDSRCAFVHGALLGGAGAHAELREVERLLGAVFARVALMPRERRAGAPRRWVWLGVPGFALIVCCVLAASFLPGPRWQAYRWHASSAITRFPRSGTLAHHGIADLVFHTQAERNPWVVIDMLQSRPIDRVIMENRRDCCYERGLPLVVEVGEDERTLREVARRTTVFDRWDVRFPSRAARFVRIRSTAFTILHLRSVQLP